MSHRRRVQAEEVHSPSIAHEALGDPVYDKPGDELRPNGYRLLTGEVVSVEERMEMLRLRGLGYPENIRYALSPSFNLRTRNDGV
jgi:hypothetical protein